MLIINAVVKICQKLVQNIVLFHFLVTILVWGAGEMKVAQKQDRFM